MNTLIKRKDGRFKSLTVEFEDMSEIDHLDYIFAVLEQNIDINKTEHNFELFYTNFFKACQQPLKEQSENKTQPY
jgi:hypothetical protein